MRIECPNCNKTYKIADEKLSVGKKFAVSCLACKSRIIIDLRSKSEQNKPLGQSKPKEKEQKTKSSSTTSFSKKGPSTIALRYGILRTLGDLPAMPHVVHKAQEIMARPDSNMKELSKLIEIEQAIATRVLRLANSAYYGMSGKVSSVQRASVLLGFKTLGELITVAGVSSLMSKNLEGYGLDSKDLWQHSMAVAFGSRIIGNRKNTEFGNEAFFAGLIHDSGKLILDRHIYERKEDFESFMGDGQENFLNAEQQILGFDHSEIAAELCEKWKIPVDQRLAIRFHHYPSQSKGNELAYILHLADCIAMMNGFGTGNDIMLYQIEGGTMEFLDLQEEDISSIKSEVMESVEKASEEIGGT